MLTTEHTCSIVRFNSLEIKPAVSHKMLCRGQIELLKRAIVYEILEKQQSTNKDQDL